MESPREPPQAAFSGVRRRAQPARRGFCGAEDLAAKTARAVSGAPDCRACPISRTVFRAPPAASALPIAARAIGLCPRRAAGLAERAGRVRPFWQEKTARRGPFGRPPLLRQDSAAAQKTARADLIGGRAPHPGARGSCRQRRRCEAPLALRAQENTSGRQYRRAGPSLSLSAARRAPRTRPPRRRR